MVRYVPNDMVGMEQGLLDELTDVSVLGFVEDPGALPPSLDEAGEPELGQVLGHRRRLATDVIGEFVD